MCSFVIWETFINTCTMYGTYFWELDIWTFDKDNRTTELLDNWTFWQVNFLTSELFNNWTFWQLNFLTTELFDYLTPGHWSSIVQKFRCTKFRCTKVQMYTRSNVQWIRNLEFSCLKFSYQKFRCPALVLLLAMYINVVNKRNLECND